MGTRAIGDGIVCWVDGAICSFLVAEEQAAMSPSGGDVL